VAYFASLLELPEVPTGLAVLDTGTPGDGITSGSSISGFADPSVTVTIYDENTQLGSTQAGAEGAWSYDLPNPESGHHYDLTATATNAAQQVSAHSAALDFTYAASDGLLVAPGTDTGAGVLSVIETFDLNTFGVLSLPGSTPDAHGVPTLATDYGWVTLNVADNSLTYTLNPAAVASLGKGEMALQQTVDVTGTLLIDGLEVSYPQQATFLIRGANDAPTVLAGSFDNLNVSGNGDITDATPLASAQPGTATVTLVPIDADVFDHVHVSVPGGAKNLDTGVITVSTPFGLITLTPDDPTSSNVGGVDVTFTLNPMLAAVRALPTGSTETVTVGVTFTDDNGGVTTQNVSFDIVGTNYVPAAGTLAFSGLADTGSSNSDRITQDNSFDLSLTGNEAGSSVAYDVSTNDGQTWTTTTAAQANLADGSYQFRAVVTDAAGNTANTAPISAVIDTAPTNESASCYA